MAKAETTLPVSQDTWREVKSRKRKGQTYDSLIRAMLEQYDPEAADVEVPA
jgi:hypothetical protein